MSAQPHMAVICVTCGSRLKVVDRRLIGGIANCPKCGAMVEITQSAVQSAAPASQPRSPEQRLPQPRANRPRVSIGPEAGIDSEALTQSTVASPQDLDAMALSGSADDLSDAHDSEQTGQGRLAAASLPADPTEVWQSESSRRVSQLGLVVTLGLFGLIAATVAFTQFARSWSRPAEQETAMVSENGLRVENDLAIQAIAAPPSIVEDNGPPASGETPDEPPPGADPDIAPPEDDSLGSASAGDVVQAADPAGPAGLPQSPDLAQPPGLAEIPGGIDHLPPGLRKFVPLLNQSTAENGPPRIFDAPPTIDSIRLDAAAGEEIDEDAAAKRAAIDIPRALAMRFAVDHDGVTLAELMLLVSQMTGAAVELELISLDVAGISTTDSLKTPPGWMSVQQWLDQSLAPAGMVAEIVDERVLVYATPQKIVQASGSALRLDDFGDSAAEIARWVRPVVGPIGASAAGDDAEDPWSFVAEENRLDVPLDRAALIRTTLALESARMIRGLPGRLPRWQTARWIGPWSPEAAGRREGLKAGEEPGAASNSGSAEDAIKDWPIVIAGVSGAPLDSPRTTSGLLRQLAAENRVAIIVAWRDAMRHQVYPADLAMPFNENASAGALIDELVGESGLQARDAGNAVWWIGSQANYDRYEVICWLTIPAGSGEATARQLAEALGIEDPAALPVAWDETTVLVRAPRFIARQLSRFVKP